MFPVDQREEQENDQTYWETQQIFLCKDGKGTMYAKLILIVLLESETFFQETFCFHFVGHKLQALSKTDNLIMLS